MIIFWKWRTFKHHAVDGSLLSRQELAELHGDLPQFQDKYWDEYAVHQITTQGTIPENPAAKVVRAFAVKDDLQGDEVIQVVCGLVDLHAAKDADVLVFMHRKDGFKPDDVAELLGKSAAKKCFLFGEGRDFIYHNTFNEGLLGDGGYFFSQTPGKEQTEIEVANDDKKIVFQPHFDKVWNYYQHEFNTKIFQLKEDLLSHFFRTYPDEVIWTQAQYLAHLQKDEVLHLRVKSFIDNDCARLENGEEKDLAHHERKNKKSFIFDDCKKNLGRVAGADVEKKYEALSELLCGLMFRNEPDCATGKTLNQHLRVLQNEFRELIDVL